MLYGWKVFDGYKLSRWICPSNCNRFSDRARYWSKIIIFSYPLAFDASVRGVPIGIAPPRFFTEKLEWLGYPMVKKFRRYLYSVWHNSQTWQTERQTDGQKDTAFRHIPRLCIASRCKNSVHGNGFPNRNAKNKNLTITCIQNLVSSTIIMCQRIARIAILYINHNK